MIAFYWPKHDHTHGPVIQEGAGWVTQYTDLIGRGCIAVVPCTWQSTHPKGYRGLWDGLCPMCYDTKVIFLVDMRP